MKTNKNTQRFIKSLKRRKNIRGLYIFIPKSNDHWLYYYSITGFLNNLYFSVYIRESKNESRIFIEIDSNTYCPEEIKTIMAKFNLIPT